MAAPAVTMVDVCVRPSFIEKSLLIGVYQVSLLDIMFVEMFFLNTHMRCLFRAFAIFENAQFKILKYNFSESLSSQVMIKVIFTAI